MAQLDLTASLQSPNAGSPFEASSSPFLRRAAEQPVKWRAWEPSSFREAKRSGKLVLLWVGASWCHWCHEMGRSAFGDPALAKLINTNFVPIVIDRDLRPDIDRRYQRVILTLSGRGGWPLLAVLTPNGDAIFGGGFFSARGEGGHPGLIDILPELVSRWETEQEPMTISAAAVTRQAIEIEAMISGRVPSDGSIDATLKTQPPPEPTPVPALLAAQAADRVAGSIMATFDPLHGGFGQAPRFPHGASLDLLLTYAESTGQDEPLDRTLHALSTMANGAIRDPLTGLFFRYSVDDNWQHPGFEVLLPTNAEMLSVYLHAYQLTGRAKYKIVAEELLDGIMQELALPSGGFAASLGGEGPRGEEGGHYTWTSDELQALLTEDEFAALQSRMAMEGPGPLSEQPGNYVPMVARSIPEVAHSLGKPVPETKALIDSALRTLEETRAKRHQLRDQTIIVAWNARTASVLFEAERILDRQDAGLQALQTMELIVSGIDPERTVVPHILPPSPFAGMDLSETRINTVLGLLDAFEATGDPAWLAQAQTIMDGTLEGYWDETSGGFYDTPLTSSKTPLADSRWKDVVDGLLPSTNGLGIIALQRLSRWTGDPRYGDLARQGLSTFEPVGDALGLLGATWGRAALSEADPPPIVIIAKTQDGDASALLEAARRTFRPGTSVVQLSIEDLPHLQAYELVVPKTAAAGPQDTPPGAYGWVCSLAGCSAPQTQPMALVAEIQTHGRNNQAPVVAPRQASKLP